MSRRLKYYYMYIDEGVTAKIMRMPDDARQKLTKTLGRMINEKARKSLVYHTRSLYKTIFNRH